MQNLQRSNKMNNEEPMSKEPNKPIPAQELSDKELEGVNGGGIPPCVDKLHIVQYEHSVLDIRGRGWTCT